jgi:hypothetical protein
MVIIIISITKKILNIIYKFKMSILSFLCFFLGGISVFYVMEYHNRSPYNKFYCTDKNGKEVIMGGQGASIGIVTLYGHKEEDCYLHSKKDSNE